MEKEDAKAGSDKSLMDKIASDPEIINRSLADTGEKPVVVAPLPNAPTVTAAAKDVPPDGRMGSKTAVPVMNLLKPNELPTEQMPAATPSAQASAVHKRKVWPVVVVVVVVLSLGGVAYVWLWSTQSKKQVARVTPTPTPTPTPTITPSPTPTPTPSPSPTPTPPPQEVTAPAQTPTADHPQTVTVTSPSGLWLRSSPNSSNRSNIIGWMPNGAKVSVDQVGDFWWHGTYNGKAGYFAVNYTH